MQLNFTMRGKWPLLCLWDFNLEIRDGSNQSANFLGEFCGDYGIGVVRSSGRYMWLKFIGKQFYDFAAFYTGRSNNETGMEFLSIYIYIYIYMQKYIYIYIYIYLYIYIHPISKCILNMYTFSFIGNIRFQKFVNVYQICTPFLFSYIHIYLCI